MFNKHKYLKKNDKKKLHKIKKQWVVVSLMLLLAVGSGAITIHASTNSIDNNSVNNSSSSLYSINHDYKNHQANVNESSSSKALNNKTNVRENLTNTNSQYIDPLYNQNFHFNVKKGFFGDIEALVPKVNRNKINSYYLYTMVSPTANLSKFSWGRYNTRDFTHFTPVNNTNNTSNIAISSDTFWSVTSGSIINNDNKIKHDIYGHIIKPNAYLAYFDNGALAYSNDGEQYQPYGNSPVINQKNYNINGDFRDPFIMRNPYNKNEWDAYIAGGTHHTIFVFTSNDGINWDHDSNNDIYLNGSGVAETPNIQVLGGKPVMFTSCEPLWPSNIVGFVYYTNGHFDKNGLFKADSNTITKLDSGLDNYAPTYTPINANIILGIGKLQDWGYSPNGNVKHLGSFLLPRIIQRSNHDNNGMDITPIMPGALEKVSSQRVNTNNNLNVKDHNKLTVNFDCPVSKFNLDLKRNDGTNNNISFSLNNGDLIIRRQDNDLNSHQNESRITALGINKLSNIEFYLDNDSIEAYIPEIHKIFTWADYTSARNANYQMTTNIPVQANVYGFNLNQAPQLGDINNVNSEYSADKAELNKDMSVLNGHTNDSVNNSKNLLNSYFGDIQNAINDANTNIVQVNNYNGDARQHVFIALANNDMDIANTKLYQADLQLKNLDNIATPYLDASAADARIANYYKTSVANSVAQANQKVANNAAHAADENIINQQKASVVNSVNAANQQKANQAAQQADQRIAQQQRTSVANSVATANRARANHAAQVADQNIINQQKQSVANSVNAANQRTTTSAANSADKSIESSIANFYAKSADNSIVNSYRNSASASVSAANSSYAKTAAGKAAAKSGASSADKSIEGSIASSYAKSADTSIANSYKNSVANSVRVANQSKANSAAKSADTSIANSAVQSADQSIENSIANSYTNLADTSIVNSYKNSVANSVRAANQSKANSAAKSADTSIANSAAQSADKSIENSIGNSYRNSVNNSVAVANQSKARSAASSADQMIAGSEAKNASQQTSSQSQQPVTPFIPMDNVIPTPIAITSNSVTNNSNNNSVISNNSSDLSSSVNTSSNVSKNVNHHASKLVMKKSANNQIPLLGLAKRIYFYQHDEAFVFTNRMKKRANVLQAIVRSNHYVVYKVRIGKRTGYMYGYLKKLARPELFTKRNMYIHVGKRMIKLPIRRFNWIKINRAVRYAGKNYVKYYVNYGRKRGVIYGKLPKITKRVLTNKGTYSKYYQVIPKRYHYVNVKKPLLIYNNKYFTKRNHRGSIRKGITIRVKRLVHDGNMTRFELMNGRYITGLKSFVKLMK